MANYRRAFELGGTFFLTLVTQDRRPLFADAANVALLRTAVREARTARPFGLCAAVVLPDHLHWIMELPDGDGDFSKRIGRVKALFTKAYRIRAAGSARPTKMRMARHGRNAGLWQKRFWEHAIRDQNDFNRHLDYIHYNPVKHGVATCPHGHSASSFKRWVRNGYYADDWQCVCGDAKPVPPDFASFDRLPME